MKENESEKSPQQKFLQAIQELQVGADQAMRKDGYTDRVRIMRLLLELMKEQSQNEDSLSSASTIR